MSVEAYVFEMVPDYLSGDRACLGETVGNADAVEIDTSAVKMERACGGVMYLGEVQGEGGVLECQALAF